MKIRELWTSVAIAALGATGCASILGIGEVPNPSDGGGPASDSGSETSADTSGATCPRTAPIDATAYPWQSPNKSAVGSCTNAEVDALVLHVFTHPSDKPGNWKSQVGNTACRDCIFGKDADLLWKPIIEDEAGDVARYYVGGCVAIVTDEGCGKAYQNLFDCRVEACADCGGDSTMLQTCLDAASEGACKKAFDAVGTSCEAARFNDALTACAFSKRVVWEGSAKWQCVGYEDGG